MAGRLKGTPKTGGRKVGTPNKRSTALQAVAAAAAEKIETTLGPNAFDGDAHALLMAVYKDERYPIGVRIDAAKAALPYEKPKLASIETKVVDEFENLSIEELEKIVNGEVEPPDSRRPHKPHGWRRPGDGLSRNAIAR
jgi:hypothetical protein